MTDRITSIAELKREIEKACNVVMDARNNRVVRLSKVNKIINSFEASVKDRIKELEKINKGFRGSWGTDADKELSRILVGESK